MLFKRDYKQHNPVENCLAVSHQVNTYLTLRIPSRTFQEPLGWLPALKLPITSTLTALSEDGRSSAHLDSASSPQLGSYTCELV